MTANEEIRRAICPEDHEIFDAWVEATYGKQGKNKAEYRIEDGEGNDIWMRISSTTICDDSGLPLKAIGVFSDISKQKAEMSSQFFCAISELPISFGQKQNCFLNCCIPPILVKQNNIRPRSV